MNNRVAIIYDFDGTLIDGEMVDDLLQELGYNNPQDFWDRSNASASKYSADRVCNYMWELLQVAKEKNFTINLNTFKEYGAKIKLRAGLTLDEEGWFAKVNAIFSEQNLTVEQYIVTSGLAEMVEHCSIANAFTRIYGSRFLYDDKTKDAIWPAQIVNHTTKTQYLFRIGKGVFDSNDDVKLNVKVAENKMYIPLKNMIFIGDGYTDIPCFSLLQKHKGYSIAVLQKSDSKKALQQMDSLMADGRVDYVSLTDHFINEGKLIDNITKIASQINKGNKTN